MEGLPRTAKTESSPNFGKQENKQILREGVRQIAAGETVYIGPLASCFGIVIPLDKGAIIAHIPPATSRNNEYFDSLISQIKNNIAEIKTAYFFHQINDNKDLRKRELIQKLNQTVVDLLSAAGVKDVKKFEYNTDNYFVIVDTADKIINAMPLHASELTKSKNTTPFEIKYS